MKRNLHFEAFYPHPPERVWRALTEPAAIERWLMKTDFQPRVGHRFQFRAEPQPGWGGITDCEILEVDPPRRLSYSWKSDTIDTVVTRTLEPATGGTRIKLAHTGFEGLKPLMVSFILGSGWKGIVRKQLRKVVDELT